MLIVQPILPDFYILACPPPALRLLVSVRSVLRFYSCALSSLLPLPNEIKRGHVRGDDERALRVTAPILEAHKELQSQTEAMRELRMSWTDLRPGL